MEQAQRVHVSRRDGEDLYLTTERHDRQREETADVTARLSAAEVREFVADLVDGTRDAVELDVHANLHRVIAGWRGTARILADPELTAQLTAALLGEDHGEVSAP